MAFQPQINQELFIDGSAYLVAEHPVAPGMPYGQEGRAATVYLVTSDGEKHALKVFKSRFRVPGMVSLARRLAPYVDLPGLRVCNRNVLTPQRDAALLRPHPDLTYAVLMPWIEGPTWMEVVLSQQSLAPEQSLSIARAFAGALAGMEQEGLAHCDLSGPNVLAPALSEATGASRQNGVELVDVEQLYGRSLERPQALPGGSPGYAHKTAPVGMWEPDADRFAGAVLVAEMLCWCDERVRSASWGESYFDPQEMQMEGERHRVLVGALAALWGKDVAELFTQAWQSETQADCATFGEWLVALPERMPATTPPATAEAPRSAEQAPASANLPLTQTQFSPGQLVALFEAGRAAYTRGDWPGAKEMLTEVVRQEPEYGRDGQYAINMLHDIDRKEQPVPPTQAPQPAQPKLPPAVREPVQPLPSQSAENKATSTPPPPQVEASVQQSPQTSYSSSVPVPQAQYPPSTPQIYTPPTKSRSGKRMGLVAVPVLLMLLLGLFGGVAVWFQSQSASPNLPSATSIVPFPTHTATEQALAATTAIDTAEVKPTGTAVAALPTQEETQAAQATEPPSPTVLAATSTHGAASPTGVVDAGPSDPPGITDFKLIPRPEASYIVEWCITGFCSEGLTATGTNTSDDGLTQHIVYHRTDEGVFDANTLLTFYIDKLTKEGWTLDQNIAIGKNKGQILRPPAQLKSRIRKVGVYFWSDGSGGKLNACTIAIVRQEEGGYPPDTSLFTEDPIRDGTAPDGSEPTPRVGSAGSPSPEDPPGLTDFKLVPRPADSNIVSWCIVGFCSEGLTATGTNTNDDGLTQHVVYQRVDKSAYDVNALLRFYIRDLKAKGWTLGNNIEIIGNMGYVFLPPEGQKSRLRKIGVYFWSNGGGGVLNACTIAIVRETPIGYPPDISLFVEDPIRDGLAPSGSEPTPVIGSAGSPNAADPPGLTDFKLVPRPAESKIISWCVTDFCSEGLTATGTNTADSDLTQHVVYHRIDESGYDTNALLRFYIRDLKAKGWILGNDIRIGNNRGYIFLPPENLKGQLRKIGVYFWSDGSGGGGGKLNACTIAIVRETPVDDQDNLNLFEGH